MCCASGGACRSQRRPACLLARPAVDEARGAVRSNPALAFQHPYPPTKVGFIPDKVGAGRAEDTDRKQIARNRGAMHPGGREASSTAAVAVEQGA